MKVWALLLTHYYVWTLCNVLWGRDDEAYYYIYFIGASVFEIVAFFVALRLAPINERKYVKPFIWAASLKMLYILLLVANIIPEANMPHHVTIYGVLVLLMTVTAVIRWRKRS